MKSKEKNVESRMFDLQARIDRLKSPEAKRIISDMCNIIDELYSKLNQANKEIQKYKNELNQLKGEQGKPNIKGSSNRNNNISTDKERRNAELSNIVIYGYKLDARSLDKLKEQEIPSEVLEQLVAIRCNKYKSKKAFLTAVEQIIGKGVTQKHKKALLKHARYKRRKRLSKVDKIVIDREQKCYVDKKLLPADACFCGYSDKVTQDIIIKSDNVKFLREVYYSCSQKQTFIGELPKGYEGGYGPYVKSEIVSMKYLNNMSEPKILDTLTSFNVKISATYISNHLTQNKHMDVFHEEKSNIYQAGLSTGTYQQIDDTSCKVNGKNHYTQIVCNQMYTAYFTTARKDRLTIIDVLRNFESRYFIFNNETFELLNRLKVSLKTCVQLTEIEKNRSFDENEMKNILDKNFPNPELGKTTKTRIMEAAAIAYYHQDKEFPIVSVLLGDDAPQFKLITENLALCWIHDGRFYKKIVPITSVNKKKLNRFQKKYWKYYKELFKFKKKPTDKLALILKQKFDRLFSTKTGYQDLDERIEKSKAKKEELLMVLKFPELPLHNNLSENSARNEKRRQDVSLQTKSANGTKSKDSAMSFVETCKKLGVNARQYVHDRVNKFFKLPSLADLIKQKHSELSPDPGG